MKNVKKINTKTAPKKNTDVKVRAALQMAGKKAVSGCPELMIEGN